MTDIDLSGVAPLRRAETRRRIEVIRKYLGIAKPSATDREAAANDLGIGTQQFMNLVRAWSLNGSATAIAKAGANAGDSRPPRNRGLPPSSRAAAEEALRGLPVSASHKAAIAAVHAICELNGTRPPSDSMVSYLRLAVRRSGAVATEEPGVVIGRATAALPMIGLGDMTLPELVMAVSKADGSIISVALIRPGDPAPDGFAASARARDLARLGSVTIGADDETLAAAFPNAEIVSRFTASRLLARLIGRGIDRVRLTYGPLASTDPNRSLRAKADAPLDRREAIDTVIAALNAHNSARNAPEACVVDPYPVS